MKRARDVRDQLVGLMERVEIDMVSHPDDHEGIKKARPFKPALQPFGCSVLYNAARAIRQ